MNIYQGEFVIVDVETTGLYPKDGDRMIEIAAIRMKAGKTLDSFESFINPKRAIPSEAQELHKISSDMVADAPTADIVLPKVIDFISGAMLVGHNIRFDLDFICYELSRIGRRLNDATPAIDTLKMARTVLPHLQNFQLISLARSLGAPIGQTHRALADAKLTQIVFKRLLAMIQEQRNQTFQDFLKDFTVTKPHYHIHSKQQAFLFDTFQ